MFDDWSTELNIILWIGVLLDIAFIVSWIKNGFFETPTLLLLIAALITMVWGFVAEKKEKGIWK
jgi:hypothetical protein|tara:strand:- start:290 stop:481 length:192 start_codon:yes stop_codon:yes gene_type:complete